MSTSASNKALTPPTRIDSPLQLPHAPLLSTTVPLLAGATTAADQSTLQNQVPMEISLAMPLMSADQLYPTPSMEDKLPFDVEFDLRFIGCELIQTAGRLLKLPQTAMATGQVLFHRFFYTKSFVKNNMEHFAMACIFLSSKIEEFPRRIRDVMNVFNHIRQLRTSKIIKPLAVDEAYYKTKNDIIKAERRILKDLGFCVHVKHPHRIIFIYLQMMDCGELELKQKAWNYMNDSLRTDTFLRYSPENIVCACIYLSARELNLALPTNPPWFGIFGADEQILKDICIRISHLYSHTPRPQEELEKIVNDCRNSLDEEKRRKQEASIIPPPPPPAKAESDLPPKKETNLDTAAEPPSGDTIFKSAKSSESSSHHRRRSPEIDIEAAKYNSKLGSLVSSHSSKHQSSSHSKIPLNGHLYRHDQDDIGSHRQSHFPRHSSFSSQKPHESFSNYHHHAEIGFSRGSSSHASSSSSSMKKIRSESALSGAHSKNSDETSHRSSPPSRIKSRSKDPDAAHYKESSSHKRSSKVMESSHRSRHISKSKSQSRSNSIESDSNGEQAAAASPPRPHKKKKTSSSSSRHRDSSHREKEKSSTHRSSGSDRYQKHSSHKSDRHKNGEK